MAAVQAGRGHPVGRSALMGGGTKSRALGTGLPEDSHLLGKCVTGKVEVSCPAYGFRCGIKGGGRVRRGAPVGKSPLYSVFPQRHR